MACRPLTRGFTLVELMAGMAIGALVAAMALTSLASGGVLFRRLSLAALYEDRAWFALGAIARDFEGNGSWRTCTEARDCPDTTMANRYRAPVYIAGKIGWLLQDGLKRCDARCETVVGGVVRLDVIADLPGHGGTGGKGGPTERRPFMQRDGDGARSLEFTLTMRDGRRFTRVVVRSDTSR